MQGVAIAIKCGATKAQFDATVRLTTYNKHAIVYWFFMIPYCICHVVWDFLISKLNCRDLFELAPFSDNVMYKHFIRFQGSRVICILGFLWHVFLSR